MNDSTIEITESGIRIIELRIVSRDVAEYLRALGEAQRSQALVQAVEVGVFCLERARAGQDLEFVRREIDFLLNRVKSALERMPEETQKQIISKIGSSDGQVLAPMRELVNHVAQAASEKVNEIRTLLLDEVDPSKETSSLSKALRALRDLLDANRTDSIQGSLNSAVNQVISETGPLAKSVRDVVRVTLQPLEEKVNELAKEVRGKESAAEVVDQTTLKGAPYELEVVRILQEWAQGIGYEVHHVGTDNQAGDVLVIPDPDDVKLIPFRIVAEARNRQEPVGRKVISETLNTAMAERKANSGIYVSKTRDGLAKEVGEWAEGIAELGPWVACTHEHLITSLRFLLVQRRIQQIREAGPTVNASSIENQIQRIRTSLARIKTISLKVGDVRSNAEEIQNEAESLRDEVKSALSDIEDALRATTNSSQ